jgi:hypothetical protein
MNKNDLLCHIGQNFKVDWDVEGVLKKLDRYVVDEPTNDLKEHHPLRNIDYPCFQKYPSGVAVTHNFSKFFLEECINLCDNLTELQRNIKDQPINSTMFKQFITVSFHPRFVRLIECNNPIIPHTDLREYALNIGLKNTSNGITNVSESKDKKNVKGVPSYEFQMNDGDVVMLNTHHAHWVNLIDTNVKRYIISYNLKT